MNAYKGNYPCRHNLISMEKLGAIIPNNLTMIAMIDWQKQQSHKSVSFSFNEVIVGITKYTANGRKKDNAFVKTLRALQEKRQGEESREEGDKTNERVEEAKAFFAQT